MKFPVLVNVEIGDAFGGQNIVACIVDFDNERIEQVINEGNGCTTIAYYNKRFVKVILAFKDVYDLLKTQVLILDDYEEEVNSYIEDNWLPYRKAKAKELQQRKKDDKGNGENNTTV